MDDDLDDLDDMGAGYGGIGGGLNDFNKPQANVLKNKIKK